MCKESRRLRVDSSHNQHHRRTNLFLVRLWTDKENDENEDDGGEKAWHGRVQRVVDGESHRFDSLQGLVEMLRDMLSAESEAR
jgi:hypothetical protein